MPEVLFAPWRYEYLVAEKSEACIFCEAAASEGGDESLVVSRGRRVFVILNRYPYTNGHLMVAPYRHEARLSDSDEETLSELVTVVARGEKILGETYRTDGLNIGVNLGSAAGAGISGHYHVHLVPRWSGDTNFMTVAANVRVVPEELSVTRRRLAPLFEKAGR
ncbi:MAG TPA: HIT domain-containing protein [Thermoanaerobaculia bacterium]|jgi:ATP adenylyltransferase|nr:HIT domain-containing protein [Thermoanaerobaculia bacterium]